MGPLGTYDQFTLVESFLFWAPISVLALAIGGLSYQFVLEVMPDTDGPKQVFCLGIGFTMLFSPLIYAISEAQILTHDMPSMSFAGIVGVVAGFTVVFGLLCWFLPSPIVEKNTEQKPRLYARLPDVGTAKVARLSVSDHYTVVYMSDGSTHRLLMRFADAVREMDDVEGFCTHRSHWVARHSIVEGARRGNRELVVLDCGTEVPVSKTYRQFVADAGFL